MPNSRIASANSGLVGALSTVRDWWGRCSACRRPDGGRIRAGATFGQAFAPHMAVFEHPATTFRTDTTVAVGDIDATEPGSGPVSVAEAFVVQVAEEPLPDVGPPVAPLRRAQ